MSAKTHSTPENLQVLYEDNHLIVINKRPGEIVQGDITGDMSGMRGWVNGTTALPGNHVEISGQVPLSELGNYQSKLKSITGGEGSFTMEFSHYESVPPKTQQELAEDYKPGEEGD